MAGSVGLFKVFLRELAGPRSLSRGHAPGHILADERQIEALQTGGRVDGRTAAGYLFHAAHISETIQDCRQVVDLGCGTAVQLLQVAGLNPDIQFLGLDNSASMLQVAAEMAGQAELSNVDFQQADMTALAEVPDASIDGVICTMALHYLPSITDLDACLSEMARILKPGGALYIEDFGRLNARSSVDYFVGRGAPPRPDAFSELYAASLKSAFLGAELRASVAGTLPDTVRAYATFPIPFLMVFKTAARGLAPDQRIRLRRMSEALPAEQRRDLADLRLSFKLGGLGPDLFK